MYHHIAIMYFKLLRETLRHLPRSPTERLQSGILENERNSSLVDSSGYRGSTVTGRNEARERERGNERRVEVRGGRAKSRARYARMMYPRYVCR